MSIIFIKIFLKSGKRKAAPSLPGAALQRAMGHQIGSDVTDRHYIDRAAQVQDAAQEFAKMADTVRKLAT